MLRTSLYAIDSMTMIHLVSRHRQEALNSMRDHQSPFLLGNQQIYWLPSAHGWTAHVMAWAFWYRLNWVQIVLFFQIWLLWPIFVELSDLLGPIGFLDQQQDLVLLSSCPKNDSESCLLVILRRKKVYGVEYEQKNDSLSSSQTARAGLVFLTLLQIGLAKCG